MAILSLIALLVFVFFFCMMYFMQQKKELKVGQQELQDAKNTQSLVAIEDFERGVLDLGDGKYKAILECIPQNYNLKSHEERKNFILSLRCFFDSLTQPICINVQTKEISLAKFIESIKSKKITLESRYPNNPFINAYHKNFIKSVEDLPLEYGNTKQKNIYIVLSCDSMKDLYELSPIEKKNEAYRQLDIFATSVINGLSSAGIVAKRIQNIYALEVLYNALNKNGFSSELFSDTQDFPLIVSSATDISQGIIYSEKTKVDNLLYGIQNQLNDVLSLLKKLPEDETNLQQQTTMVRIIGDEIQGVRDYLEENLAEDVVVLEPTYLKEEEEEEEYEYEGGYGN